VEYRDASAEARAIGNKESGVSGQAPDGDPPRTRANGRERILEAALAILEHHGEAALKFVDIAARAGVAVSAITHHFGSREGLLSAVHARRFSGLLEPDLVAVRQFAQAARDRQELQASMAALTDAALDENRSEVRLARIMSIGAMHERRDLEVAVRRTATKLLDELEHGILIAQAKGLIDRKVEARVFATFVQAYGLGMIIADLDETPVSREALARLIDRLNFSLLTDPDD
jgi:AcrR family transcriptional regulator